MREIFTKLLERLDAFIAEENRRRREDGALTLGKAKLLVLGQLALFLHPDERLKQLKLVATIDLDARVVADPLVEDALRMLLEQHDLELDADADKVWIPEKSTFTRIFETGHLECGVLDPVYVLTSKAIKAQEKNRFLIRAALQIFGAELREKIEQHGGNCDDFT